MNILPVWVYVPCAHGACEGQKKVLNSLELELTDGRELLRKFWGLNLGPRDKQPVLLMLGHLQPQGIYIFESVCIHQHICATSVNKLCCH